MANALNTDSWQIGTSRVIAFAPTRGNLLILALACTADVATPPTGVVDALGWTEIPAAKRTGANSEHESVWVGLAAGGIGTINYVQTASEGALAEYPVHGGLVSAVGTPQIGVGNGVAITSPSYTNPVLAHVFGVSWNTPTGAVTYTGAWTKDVESPLNNELISIASIMDVAAASANALSTSGTYANWESVIFGVAVPSIPATRTTYKRGVMAPQQRMGF